MRDKEAINCLLHGLAALALRRLLSIVIVFMLEQCIKC